MKTKHFHAILAKNALAREVRDGKSIKWPGVIEINAHQLQAALEDIEAHIGEANQPCVSDIINDERGWL